MHKIFDQAIPLSHLKELRFYGHQISSDDGSLLEDDSGWLEDDGGWLEDTSRLIHNNIQDKCSFDWYVWKRN